MLSIGTKSVTLNDLERPSDRYVALFLTKRQLSEPTVSNSLKLDGTLFTVSDKNEARGV